MFEQFAIMFNRVLLFFCFAFLFSGCAKTAGTIIPPVDPPVEPPVGKTAYLTNEYDALYRPLTGPNYAYHIRDTLYYYDGKKDSSFGRNLGAVALVTTQDTSLQHQFDYFIGSYLKLSFFRDTVVGNLQFMVPMDGFPAVDSIPEWTSTHTFRGGINGYYRSMAKSEIKISSTLNIVQFGDGFSYADPAVPAIGLIDSAEVIFRVKRFSDNGIHPNASITKTIDGSYTLNFFMHDGTSFSIINAEFYNLFFQVGNL